MEETRKRIRNTYFSPKSTSGFNSLTAFLKNSKYKNRFVVNDVLNSLKTYSVHKGIRRHYPTRKVMCNSIDQFWTWDLAIMPNFRSNSFFKYIFVVQDIYSKFIWAVAIKKKETDAILDAIKQVLKKANGRKPGKVWADQEGGWMKKIDMSGFFKVSGYRNVLYV